MKAIPFLLIALAIGLSGCQWTKNVGHAAANVAQKIRSNEVIVSATTFTRSVKDIRVAHEAFRVYVNTNKETFTNDQIAVLRAADFALNDALTALLELPRVERDAAAIFELKSFVAAVRPVRGSVDRAILVLDEYRIQGKMNDVLQIQYDAAKTAYAQIQSDLASLQVHDQIVRGEKIIKALVLAARVYKSVS